MWFISQPSVFLRFWTQNIHWDPDCNEMPYLTLNLADVVCFSPNVKTRLKWSKISNFLSLDIPLVPGKNLHTIPIPSGIQKHLIFNPKAHYSAHKVTREFFVIQELNSFETFWSLL